MREWYKVRKWYKGRKRTWGHYGPEFKKKNRKNKHPIIDCSTSSGMSEVSERSGACERSKLGGASE